MLCIRASHVIPVSSPVVTNGLIAVEHGKIVYVGPEDGFTVPLAAELIDMKDAFVCPGFIDAHCHAGIYEEGIRFEGEDCNEMTDPVTPSMRAIDGIYPGDMALADAASAGVTCICVGPGSANVIGGEMAVIKTVGDTVESMLVKNPAGLKIAFGENPKRVYNQQKKTPMTRMGTAALLRKAIVKAEGYRRKLEAAKSDPDKAPDRDLDMEAICRVLNKEMPLRAHAHRSDDIMTAIRIAEEFGLGIVIEHCTEGHKIAVELKRRGISAIVGPTLTARSKYELRERSFRTPAILAEAGVKVAIMTDHPVVPLSLLPLCAAIACKEGMTEDEALRAITLNPAEILGIADRVGSLDVGKDADLVVLSGHPLDVRSKVLGVWVNGDRVISKG